MTTIRVTVRNAEAVVRPDQAELWVQGESISPGDEKTFDLAPGEPFNVEARLTDEQEQMAVDIAEADKRVPGDNEKLREEKEKKDRERKERLEGKKNQEGGGMGTSARASPNQAFQTQRQGQTAAPGQSGQHRGEGETHRGKAQGFASSPAPKVEAPPKQTESRSGIDSKEVKGEAPLKK